MTADQTSGRGHGSWRTDVPLIQSTAVHVGIDFTSDHGHRFDASRTDSEDLSAQRLLDPEPVETTTRPRYHHPRDISVGAVINHRSRIGSPGLFPARNRDRSRDRLAVGHQRHVDRPVWRVPEIARPVEWVDDPDAVVPQPGPIITALLGKHYVIGSKATKLINDEPMGSTVTFVFEAAPTAFLHWGLKEVDQKLTGLLSDLNGNRMVAFGGAEQGHWLPVARR